MHRIFIVLTLIALGAAACSGFESNTAAPGIPAQSPADRSTGPSATFAFVGHPIVPDGKRVRGFGKRYKQTTVTLDDSGGTFVFPQKSYFSGTGSYTANNAPAGATLQITNSGAQNPLGVPVSATGTVVLNFEAQIGNGAQYITFEPSSKTMTLSAKVLQAGASYQLVAYLWNHVIELYSVGSPSNGRRPTLTFQTPFSDLTMYYYTPIGFELVMLAAPTPSPSPSSTPSATPPPTLSPSPPPTLSPSPPPTLSPTPPPTLSPPPTLTPSPPPTMNPTPTPQPSSSPTASPHPQTLYAAYDDPVYGGVYSFDANNFGSAPFNFNPIPSAFAAAVDDAQNLYISSASGPVREFYIGGGTFTYDDKVASPTALAANSGYMPAINVANGSGVSGYAQLLTFPQQVDQATPFMDPNLSAIQSVTADAAGNRYVGGISTQGGPEVDLLSTGLPSNLGLQLSGTPTGLALDQAGDLLVTESQGVAVFAPGQTTPYTWIGSYGQTPFALTFGDSGNRLYVVYNSIPCYSSCINVYGYPSGALLGTYSLTGTPNYYGVAISPRVPLFNPNAMRHKHSHRKYWTDFYRNGRRMGGTPHS